MPKKSNGRLRSIRGQKLEKEFRKEELMRRANMTYLRSNVVANEDGRRVSVASQPTKQVVEDSNSKHEGTNTVNENLNTLPMGPKKSNPRSVFVSRDTKQFATSNLKNHLPSSSKNIKETGCGDEISLAKETHVSMGSRDDWVSSENLEVQVPLKAAIHGTNSVESLRSTIVQTMDGPIHMIEGVVGLRYHGVVPLGSKVKPSSCQENAIAMRKNGTKKVIGEGVEQLDRPSSKAMESQPRYTETNEDEYDDVNDKNPTSVGTNEVGELDGGNKNPACVKDVQLENLTCDTMKKQRETKQDIDHDEDDGVQNLVDILDDNGGDIRPGHTTTMNNDTTIDRGIQSLIGVDGKIRDAMSKGRKESMQRKRYVTIGDDVDEVMRLTYGSKKKRSRYIVTSEDDEADADSDDYDRVGFKSKAREESKAEVMLMDSQAKVTVPFILERDEQQCYCCSKPIDEPIWRGTLKIDGKEYTSLVGHLSTKSSEKVWNLSRSLQMSVEVMKLSRSNVTPKIWDSSKPSDDDIGLFFFPSGMRHDANLDQLINEVMENDLVLQAVIDEAEMLIFPSCLLPKRYKTFQRKHYLWALFKRRGDNFAVAAEPINAAVWCAQNDVDDVEPNQETIWMRSVVAFESQGLVDLHSVNCKSPTESTQQVSAGCIPGASNVGFELKALDQSKQEDARRHSVHTQASAAATNSTAVITEATALATNAANIPANLEQFNSSMEVQRFGFVARQTPRIKEILQELEREKSLLFATQVEAIDAGPRPGSIATTMQQ